MTKRRWTAICSLLLSTAQPETGHAAVEEDMFVFRNKTDLVGLCSAGQTDPLYVTAIHSCFGSGAYGVASEYEAARRRARLFCLPSADRRPSRNTAIAEAVQWAGAGAGLDGGLIYDNVKKNEAQDCRGGYADGYRARG